MITNFAEGNREISAYILAVFMLTAINQIINYLKSYLKRCMSLQKIKKRLIYIQVQHGVNTLVEGNSLKTVGVIES